MIYARFYVNVLVLFVIIFSFFLFINNKIFFEKMYKIFTQKTTINVDFFDDAMEADLQGIKSNYWKFYINIETFNTRCVISCSFIKFILHGKYS